MYSFNFLKKVVLALSTFLFLTILYFLYTSKKSDSQNLNIFYRWNQVSHPAESFIKPLILADKKLTISKIELLDSHSETLQTVPVKKIADYNFMLSNYEVTLPILSKGTYFLKALDKISPPYVVGDFSHSEIISNTLKFFNVQRCGFSSAQSHTSCHKEKITILDAKSKSVITADLSGGWHDAGDYLRFVFTTSYSTFMLLSAAEELDKQDPIRARILEEAEWGLLWLKKMFFNSNGEFYQIGDVSDHTTWRLPEADTRDDFQIKAYKIEPSSGANLYGRTIACIALYSRLMAAVDSIKADEWKQTALQLFERSKGKNSAQKSTDNFYNETLWQDDMALAGLTMYELTEDVRFLKEASKHIQSLPDIWYFSYDQMLALTYYRWAKVDPKKIKEVSARMEKILTVYQDWSHKNVFSQAMDHLYWGSQTQILGAGITALLYQKLSSQKTFQKLALEQWDFTLGRNPWGRSFVYGVGIDGLKKPHHQIGQIKTLELIGYWAPGAVSLKNWQDQKITLSEVDSLKLFQSENAVIYDDRQDYVTNEPTISVAATGILFTALMQSLF